MPAQDDAPRQFEKRQQVNTRLLFILFAILVIGAPGLYFLNQFQQQNTAVALKAEGDRQREQGELDKAISYYAQYLKLRPDAHDYIDSVATLAEMRKEVAESRQDRQRAAFELQDAFEKFEEVLRRDPGRDAIRRKTVEVCLALRRLGHAQAVADARAHLEKLLAKHPQDGQLHYWQAQCDIFEQEFERADQRLAQALELGYDEVTVYQTRAALLRQLIRPPQPERADEIIRELESKFPNSFEAVIVVAQYRARYGDLQSALASAQSAFDLASNDLERMQAAIMEASYVTQVSNATPEQFEQARKRLTEATEEQAPASIYLVRHDLELAAGNPDTALEILEQARTALPDSYQIVATLATDLLNRREFAQAEELVKPNGELDRLDAPQAERQYLEGRLLLERTDGKSDLLQAERRFQRVRTLALSEADGSASQFSRGAQLARNAGLKLGECYRRMGRYEEQLAEFERVLELFPDSREAQRGKADALIQLGRQDEAEDAASQLAESEDSPLQKALKDYQEVMRQPPGQRNWDEVENSINTLLEEDPNSINAQILKAEVLLAQGKTNAAEESLRSVTLAQPSAVAAWVARAEIAMRQTEWDKALDLLNEARESTGDSVTLRLALADYWNARKSPESAARLDELAENLDGTIPPNQQAALLGELASRRASRGELVDAQQLWSRAAALSPDNVQLQFRLFNMSKLISLTKAPDERDVFQRAMEDAQRRLVRVEGEDGPFAMATKVVNLIEPDPLMGTQPTASDLDAARALLSRIAASRPTWSFIPLGRGQIDMLEAATADEEQAELLMRSAADNHLLAIQAGSRDPRMATRLTTMLINQSRWRELGNLMRLLSNNSGDLLRRGVRAEILRRFVQLKQSDTADDREAQRQLYQVAQDSVAAGSTDYQDIYFLGQLRLADGQKDAAIADFARAVENSPGFADGWIALVQTLIETDQADEARRILEQSSQRIPVGLRPQLFAACYELLNEPEKAEEQWREALSANANHPAFLQNLVNFYVRTQQMDKAEALLRPVLQTDGGYPPSTIEWARRSLATVLTQSTTPRFEEALQLLSEGGSTEADQLAAQVIKARLLASRPYPKNIEQAIQLLEQVEAQQPLNLENERFLAGLLDAAGKHNEADRRWATILGNNSANGAVIAAYIRRQIEQGNVDDAQQHLSKLITLAPTAYSTAELQARLALKVGNATEAARVMQAYVDQEDTVQLQRADRLRSSATLLEGLFDSLPASDHDKRQILAEAAERYYRELAELNPDTILGLARFLGKQGQLDSALDLCERAIQQARTSVLPATATAVGLLHVAKPTDAQIERVEGLLELAQRDAPRTLAGLLQLAELRDLHEQRYDEAITLYQQLLAKAPQHFVALNNLAWLLSTWKQDHAQATELINRALEIAGEMPALLDTRGMIELSSGQTEAAIATFEQALSLEPSGLPAANYHLAQALLKLGKREDAAFNMRKALESGVTASDLHPLERDEFVRLSGVLAGETQN